MASPVPRVKRPVRNRPYVRVEAAGTNSKAPKAMAQSPYIIPFLNPNLLSSIDAGIAITKYAM